MKQAALRSPTQETSRAADKRRLWQAVRRELWQVQAGLGFSALVEPHPKFLVMHPYWTQLVVEDEF